MKLTLFISSATMTAAASFGTRRRISSAAYEFGRPVAVHEDEVKEAFREMNFSAMRMLGEGDMSIPAYGMSMPDYSMSMPDFSMSMPDYSMSMPDYSMSMPDYGMSMPDYGMSMPHTAPPSSLSSSSSSSSEDEPVPCVPVDTTGGPSGILTFTLEVEVLNDDAGFVGDLTQGLLNAAASQLGVCLTDSTSGERRHLEDASGIIGLEVHDRTTVVTSDSCAASSPEASCEVVYVVLQYYTNGEISVTKAAQMVFTALLERLSIEDALLKLFGNSNIVGLRVRLDEGDEGEDGPESSTSTETTENADKTENTVTGTDNGSNAGHASRSGGGGGDGDGFTGTTRTVTLTMLSLVAVSAVAILVYKKSSGSSSATTNDDDLNSSSSSFSGSRGVPMAEESTNGFASSFEDILL